MILNGIDTLSNYDVDIVILSLNRAVDTIKSIESVLDQVGVGVIIWVVDQGSDKDNLDLLKLAITGYKNVRVCELGKNYGVPGGRNRGIAMGKSEIVVCIDNDAVFKDKTCLLQTIKRFRANEKLGVLGYRIENYNTNVISRSDWVYPRALLEKSFESFPATRFCGAGHAVRRKAFEDSGGYDEELFFYWEELDLSYKIINLDFEIIYDPSIVVLHKVSVESRVNWGDRRFYFLVRNAIYIDWKHFQSINRLLLMMAGYMVKGAYNGLYWQALTGIVDGLTLSIRRKGNFYTLGREALEYIRKYELVHRGGFFYRIRMEVLEKIV